MLGAVSHLRRIKAATVLAMSAAPIRIPVSTAVNRLRETDKPTKTEASSSLSNADLHT